MSGSGATAGAGGSAERGGTARRETSVPPTRARAPNMALYLSCGETTGLGKVYQVDEDGRVLGIVSLPQAATGIALQGQNALVLAVPRDGGRILRIDSAGTPSTVLERTRNVVHPVDVATAARPDAILMADNLADVLATVPAGGGEPTILERFADQKWTSQAMSVAVTTDRSVILGTDGRQGVYRFAADAPSADAPSGARSPVLPGHGGVAADAASPKWAATQQPNLVYVFQGEDLVKKLRLPPGKGLYRGGLLSFGPSSTLVVAARRGDEAGGEVWFLQYGVERDEQYSLFPWTKEPVLDFVVGPRMPWGRRTTKEAKSVY